MVWQLYLDYGDAFEKKYGHRNWASREDREKAAKNGKVAPNTPPLEKSWRAAIAGDEHAAKEEIWGVGGSGATMKKAGDELEKYLDFIDPNHILPRFKLEDFSASDIDQVEIGPIMYGVKLNAGYYRGSGAGARPTQNVWHAAVLMRKGGNDFGDEYYVHADSLHVWYGTNDSTTEYWGNNDAYKIQALVPYEATGD